MRLELRSQNGPLGGGDHASLDQLLEHGLDKRPFAAGVARPETDEIVRSAQVEESSPGRAAEIETLETQGSEIRTGGNPDVDGAPGQVINDAPLCVGLGEAEENGGSISGGSAVPWNSLTAGRASLSGYRAGE